MAKEHSVIDLETVLGEVDDALGRDQLTTSSAAMIRRWLTEPQYAEYVAAVADDVRAGKWQQLDDVFWRVIPFGTAGRRGVMYPIGSNAVNDRTIGESAQGLADYVAQQFPSKQLACAIAYDTRHNSRRFAELCAEVLAAADFKVFFLKGHRSTPELSFAVRHTQSLCGIMITASHNPPSDNAVKVYWTTGVQVLPPHDDGIIQSVMAVQQIERLPLAQAIEAGKVVFCENLVDPAYIAAVKETAFTGSRSLRILYSPLHGVGATSVLPALETVGFRGVELFAPHAEPHGDFPNVPGHVANPEDQAIYGSIIKGARQIGAELVLVSDPDADRIGAAAPLRFGGSDWKPLNGNQIAALLAEWLLSNRQRACTLTPRHYVCKTLLTTEMVRRIANSYGVQTHGDMLVGCKWIGKDIDDSGPDYFVFGCEEAHGYLIGAHVRDKDAAVAAVALAELAAACRKEGMTLHEKLDALYLRYGYHLELQVSLSMPGASGLDAIQRLMGRLRSSPPIALGGNGIVRLCDYLNLEQVSQSGVEPLAGPRGDLVVFDLAREGTYVAVRPSGTEPKIKIYLFAYEPSERVEQLEMLKSTCTDRLARIAEDVLSFAKASS